MWYIEEETLSDGSKAYNLTDGETVIPCLDRDSAEKLTVAFDRYTTVELSPIISKK